MGLPRVTYNAGAGQVVVQCVRGPQNFVCKWETRAHDNVATSGVRERVVEAHDLMIAFEMRHMKVGAGEDLEQWAAFMKFALGGGQFLFSPNSDLADFYNCVSEDEGFEVSRAGPGVYGASFKFRIVPDAQAPADPGVVMKRFYGITS